MRLRFFLSLTLIAAAQAQGGPHWVATWTTAQPLIRSAPAGRGAAQPPADTQPAPSVTPLAINARGFYDQTVRMIVRTSIGGPKVRIKLSSPFGSVPVTIGGAHIALRSGSGADIVPASDHALAFN